MNRACAVAAALALSGCGDWSSEDVRFLAALPTRADLRVEVPAGVDGALAPCEPGRDAGVWLSAKPTSDGLNAAVDFVLRLVDAVRRVPPTDRSKEDERRWGPWDDERHPGRELQVIIVRSGEGTAVEHRFTFEARVKGQGEFRAILGGTFVGPSAERGEGALGLNFEALWELGMNDADTPHGVMFAGYDRTSEPRLVGINMAQPGFGVRPFEYRFAGFADGSGWFEYRIPNNLDTLTITAGFDQAGAGRGLVGYESWLGFGGEFRQCWDAGACLVYVEDPDDYSCDVAPCSFGELASCAAVPISPF